MLRLPYPNPDRGSRLMEFLRKGIQLMRWKLLPIRLHVAEQMPLKLICSACFASRHSTTHRGATAIQQLLQEKYVAYVSGCQSMLT